MSSSPVTVIGTLLITSLVLAVLVGLAAAAVMMSRGPRTALGLALPVPPGSRPFFGRPSLPKRWELMPRIAAIDRTSATPGRLGPPGSPEAGRPARENHCQSGAPRRAGTSDGVGSHRRQQDRSTSTGLSRSTPI